MKQRHFFLPAIVFLLAGAMSLTVLAGGINAAEARIIGAASGTFQYNGKTYAAGSGYLGQLQAKLAEDGVDLTESQASSLISQMYASVGEGVRQGVLYEVGGSSDGDTDDSDGKDSEKESKKDSGGNNKKDKNKSDNGGNAAAENEAEQPVVSPLNSDYGENLRDNEAARNYRGFDIYEIYMKPEEERTEAEQQVLDEYISAEAVEKLMEHADVSSDSMARYWVAAGIGLLAVLILAALAIQIKKRIRFIQASKLGIKDFTDIHSHILPGVDDGSTDMETTMKMMEAAYAQGVRTIIATPHYSRRRPGKGPDRLREILQKVKQAAAEKYPGFHLLLANEILYSDSIPERLEDGQILTLAGSRYVLIEFRTDASWNSIHQAVITLLRQRYIPVIAHAERYESIIKDRKHMEELHNMGAFLQVNISSIQRHKRIVQKGYIDFVATDCHDLKQRKFNMRKGVRWLYCNCDPDLVRTILVKNPERILKSKYK